MVIRVEAARFGKALRNALANVMIAAGCGGVLVWAWGMFETTLYQHVQKFAFERVLHERTARDAPADWRKQAWPPTLCATCNERSAEPPPGPPAVLPSMVPAPAAPTVLAASNLAAGLFGRDPQVLAEIEAPRLDLAVIVREGMDDETLRKAAGHVPGTALPGEPGNFVVLAHRDTLFRPLRGLEKGDSVRVRTVRGDFRYGIDSVEVVDPDSVDLSATADVGITLVTCYPFDFIGPAPRRFVARGHLISTF